MINPLRVAAKSIDLLCAPFVIGGRVVSYSVKKGWNAGQYVYGCFQEQPKAEGSNFHSRRDLKKRGHLVPDGGPYLGIYREEGVFQNHADRVYGNKNRSLIMFGVPGTGKSQMIIANVRVIQKWKGLKPDLFINDPANGEISAGTEAALSTMKYRRVVIDLVNPNNGTRYDPLGILQPDSIHFGGQVEQLCISLLPDPADPRGEHFVEFSRLWVGAVIAHMVRYRRKEASFFNCIMKATCKGEELKGILEQMEVNPDPIVQLGARAYHGVSGPERASYMTTMSTRLRKFMSVPVCMITNPGEDEAKAFIMTADGTGIDRGWTFEQVFRDPTPTAFIIRGGSRDVTGAFLRLLITNAYETRKRMMNEGFVFERAFWAYLDEAPTVGNCQAVVEMNDLMRKALMRVCLFFQTFKQLENTYGQNADTLLASCTLIICGASQDHRVHEYGSRVMGHQKVAKTTESIGSNGKSVNVSEAWERLSPPENMRQQDDKWTVLMDGGQVELHRPYWDKNGRRYY